MAALRVTAVLAAAAGAVRLAPDAAEVTAACYFAYGLQLNLTGSDQPVEHVIRASDFQRKAFDFYNGLPTAAPLNEAFWVLSLPEDFQQTVARECPALVVLSYLLVAETKLFLEPASARSYAEIGLGLLLGSSDRFRSMLFESWPIQAAADRVQATASWVRSFQARTILVQAPEAPLIDLVVAHCKENLDWLRAMVRQWSASGTGLIRLFIYEKCGQRGDAGSAVPVSHIEVVDGPPGGRKDECSAYLTHLSRVAESRDIAEYSFFLQSDALHHAEPRLLNLVVRSMQQGTLDVQFLHLSKARMIASYSPCKRAIFQQVVGRPQQGMAVGYCCAQFVVRRSAILDRGFAWRRALAAMDEALPPGCEGVRMGAGMHCLVFESIWHAMFGLNERYTPRAEDVSLPVFLRTPEMDGSILPGGSKSEMYFRYATGNDESWLDELTPDFVDVSGARAMGYISR